MFVSHDSGADGNSAKKDQNKYLVLKHFTTERHKKTEAIVEKKQTFTP